MALKKADIEKFKTRLEQLKARLQKMIRGGASEVTTPDEATGYSQHQADEGTDEFDRTIGFGVIDDEYKVLRQVERALEKIKDGTYGKCDVTGDEIPVARLEAIPYATMTVRAQEQYEKGLVE
jgi:DnaK suppressor protein